MLGPFSCNPWMLRRASLLTIWAILIPKLRTQFAEFLNQSYLARLRLLASPTCVGFDTGVVYLSLEAFLGSMVSSTSAYASSSALRHKECGFTYIQPYHLKLTNLSVSSINLLRHSITTYNSMGILTHCPSTTSFDLALGPD